MNFCKFTNETRNGIEDASRHSGQVYLSAVNGTASGGGYELALACEEIVLVDDRSSAVSLPEVACSVCCRAPAGSTRLTDKRQVRRDRAECSARSPRGCRASKRSTGGSWMPAVTKSRFDEFVRGRAESLASLSSRPASGAGVTLGRLDRVIDRDTIAYSVAHATIDHVNACCDCEDDGPAETLPVNADEISQPARRSGRSRWPGSWTTCCCISGSTSLRSEPSCSRP